MIKLFTENEDLRKSLCEVLSGYAPKQDCEVVPLEKLILNAYAEKEGWWGSKKPSFKMKYHLLACALTYWCKYDARVSIRRWADGGTYPKEMGYGYKLRGSKAKKFMYIYRDNVLLPYKHVQGIFKDPFVRDVYVCLLKHGLIRKTVLNVYKSIRW